VRPIVSVLVSLAVFALLLPKGGLALATLGRWPVRPSPLPTTSGARARSSPLSITLFTVLLFVYGLGLPLSSGRYGEGAS